MLVLCGIPGSGKSTIAAALAAASKTANSPAVFLFDFDKPTGDLLAEFDPEKWKQDRASSLLAVFQALSSLDGNSYANTSTATSAATKVNQQQLIIVDDTMHYRSMRAECWRIARATGAAYLYSHIKCPIEVALERNSHRPAGQRVPEEVLKRTAAMFEPPEENQSCLYDSELYQVMLDTEEFQIDDGESSSASKKIDGKALLCRVEAAWGPPAPAPFDEEAEAERISEARKTTSESLLHQVDVQTRKYLTELLSSLSQQEQQEQEHVESWRGSGGGDKKKKMAGDLNKERRQVLEQFRAELVTNVCDDDRAHDMLEAFKNSCREYLE